MPKSIGVTRVITGDVVASGRTNAHTVDPIGTSKAAGSTWITAEEGSYEGVGGHDGKPGLADPVGPSVVRMKNQPHSESSVQPTDRIQALLVVWSMCCIEKRVLKNAGPPKTPERLELQGINSKGNNCPECITHKAQHICVSLKEVEWCEARCVQAQDIWLQNPCEGPQHKGLHYRNIEFYIYTSRFLNLFPLFLRKFL